jgi:hypothetical protein
MTPILVHLANFAAFILLGVSFMALLSPSANALKSELAFWLMVLSTVVLCAAEAYFSKRDTK